MTKLATHYNQQIQQHVKQWVNSVSQPAARQSSLGKLRLVTALKLVNQFVGRAIPFARRNRFRVIDFRPGYVKALIPLKSNRNHFNSIYAGALFTVAELPGGIICAFSFDDDYFPVLKDLKMDFIKMAKSDVTVEFSLSQEQLRRIERQAAEEGRSTFELQGEIKDREGVIVATSHATYQLLKKRTVT